MRTANYDGIEVRILESGEYPFVCKQCKLTFAAKNYESNQIVTCYYCGAIMETETFSGGSCYNAWITNIIGFTKQDDGIWIW